MRENPILVEVNIDKDGGAQVDNEANTDRDANAGDNANEEAPLPPPNHPVIDLELEEEEGYADNYDMYADEFN